MPFVIAGVVIFMLEPWAAPVSLLAFAHAWAIPELYAHRGASVVRPKGPRNAHAEPVAQGLLGDLLAHEPRALQARTGLALERGALGSVAGGRGGGAAGDAGRPARALLLRARDRPRPAARPTASRTCCWRSERTRWASPPWPTTPSPERRGGSGAGCRRPMRPALDAAQLRGALASPAVAYEVVIAGGGFGGLYAARRLERKLPRHSARIVLVTAENFMLYTPLLPGAASGSLEPRHVVVPLREELEWTDIRLGRVTGADPAVNELSMRTVDGRDETLRYDQLVVALGSVPRVLHVPGLAEHGVGFQSLADAIGLRNRALWNLEVAEAQPDDDARRAYLTFVFVGAGYAGVEGVAELQDYVADVIDRYPRCRLEGARFLLVEAQDRIMPEIPPSLAGVRDARAAPPRHRDPHRDACSRAWTRRASPCRPASASPLALWRGRRA